jgi:type IV secretory pathway VirB4 component
VSLLKKSNKRSSSRSQIAIEGVRDGILLLPKGRYARILQVSSINFELMSEEEQDALIDTYQSFLNSLNIPFQILVRVREMDMDRYLDSFRSKTANEKKAIYRSQATNYVAFVQSLVKTNKILSRTFYVVIPIDSKDKDFDVVRSSLKLNVDMVAKGLGRLGMQVKPLNSLESLDMFYSFYSPMQAKRQPLAAQTIKLLEGAVL